MLVSIFKSRLLLVLILVAGISFKAKSQSMVVTYTESRKADRKLPDNPDPVLQEAIKNAQFKTKELTYSGGTSIYKEKAKEVEESPEHVVIFRIGDDEGSNVYKDLKHQRMIKESPFLGHTFLIKEPLTPISWKLGTEQKTIGSYNCRKASATIDTIPVVAWYCPDLPVNDGPDMYWGLPGLILELNAGNGKTVFTATHVKIMNDAVLVEVPQKGKEVSQQEFNIIRKEKLDEMRKMQHGGEGNRIEIQINN